MNWCPPFCPRTNLSQQRDVVRNFRSWCLTTYWLLLKSWWTTQEPMKTCGWSLIKPASLHFPPSPPLYPIFSPPAAPLLICSFENMLTPLCKWWRHSHAFFVPSGNGFSRPSAHLIPMLNVATSRKISLRRNKLEFIELNTMNVCD